MKRNIINVSKKAMEQFRYIKKEYNTDTIFLSLKSGGCNGFEYIIQPCNGQSSKNDEYVSVEDIRFRICGNSIMYLIGLHIDWKKDIIGQTFVFTNPISKSTCGCGSSFGI